MNKLTKQSENNTNQPKSLYLYTALIFIVALVVIVLSFFGQKNLDKINKITQDNKSISAKTAELSEQNMKLVEENRALQDTLTAKEEKIASLEMQAVQNNEVITAYNNLMTAHKFYILKDYKQTEEYLKIVDYNKLQSDSILLYTKMNDDINERKGEN